MPMVIIQALEIIGSTILAVFNAFLSLLPFAKQIDCLKDQIIAAGLGIPVIVVSAISTLVVIGKLVWRKINA